MNLNKDVVYRRLRLGPLQPLSQDGLSDRNGSIKISAAPASMRNAEWPCHVSFIGIISLVICLSAGNVSYLPSLFTCTFHQLGLLTLQRCLRIRALGSPWIVSSHPNSDWWYT